MSTATVESLELQIQSSATSATNGVDTLTASLSKLKNAVKGGVGLASVARQVSNFDTALKSIDGSSADKVSKLAESLSKLHTIGSIKISSSISNQLKNIANAATSLNSTDFSGISKLSAALQPLSNISASTGLKSTITQLQKLPQLAQSLNGVNWATLTSQLQQLSNSLIPLANHLNTVSGAFTALPANIRRVVTATNSIPNANKKAANSYVNLWARINMAITALRSGARVIASWINESNTYVESLNLFNASMGRYAKEAQQYAEQVSEIMGIDPADWMRNEGTFNTIIKGFGVAEDKAYAMSQNLTQLGYDISSFFNISVSDAMAKVSSGISGELEPLRRLGYDLSVARLQQDALNLGITKSVSAMTQAEKAQLRYWEMMKQVSVVQGDMARTLHAPANQLRILQSQLVMAARALGNVFIPILNAVIPYVIAFAKVVRTAANALANLMGFELPEVDYSGLDTTGEILGDITDDAIDVGDAFGEATKEVTKLRKSIMGFDELNILADNTSSLSSLTDVSDVLGDLGGVGDLGIELPTYDFLENAITQNLENVEEKLKEILPWVASIGASFAAWGIAKGLLSAINALSALKGANLMYSVGFKIIGLGLFLDAWKTMKEAIDDIMANGANFTNVTKLISGFAEGIGAAFILLGNIKLGGAFLIIAGIAGIVSDISDMCKNDINWENGTSLVKNLGLFITGIGFTLGNLKIAGVGLVLSGVALIVENFQALWTGITTGDWSGVEWVEVATGALLSIGGFIIAIKKIQSISAAADIGKAKTTIDTVTTTTTDLNTGMGQLNPKLKSLAKNLGLGLVIIAEIAAGAVLITGAIILLGIELEQVGIAWNPVIENGKNVAIAMGVGVGILAAFGTVTALLGSVGTTLIANLALGIAMLALLGVSAGLFIAEVWAIGRGLDEIGKAWEPVLQNGNEIATAVGIGTGLLVLVGAATAALGVATVATAGLLPLAIAIGTALLLELGVAVALFIVEIVAIGKGLDEVGKAWQPVLNNGANIASAIKLGTSLLISIGVVTAALGVASVASVGLLPLAIAIGTALLVELTAAFITFTESLIAVAYELGNRLAPALRSLNAKLPTLSSDMKNFVKFMTEFAGHVVSYTKVSAISGLSATIDTIVGWFTQDPIKKLTNDVQKVYNQFKGLNEKLKLAVPELKLAISLLKNYKTFLAQVETLTKSNITLSGGMFVNMKEVGEKLVTGLTTGIKSKSPDLQNAVKQMVSGINSGMSGMANSFNTILKTMSTWVGNFGKNMYTWGSDMMRNMVNGIDSGLNSLTAKVAVAANTIRSYLHFSQPDVGPLADFNTWMPDMMSQLADGIAKDENLVRKQVAKLASDMSLESTVQANVSAYSATPVAATAGDTESNLVNAVYTAVSSALSSQNESEDSGTPIIINLGNEQIASFMVKQNKRVALISGGKA